MAGGFGEGVVRRVGLDGARSQKPPSRCDPAHVRCHSFAEAFVMQLPLFWEQEGKEALKFSLTLAGVFFFHVFLPLMSSRRECCSVDMEGGFSPGRIHRKLLVYVVLIAQSHGQGGKGRCEKCFYTASVEMLISSFNLFRS